MKKSMEKTSIFVFLTAFLLVVALALSACGSNATPTPTSTIPPTSSPLQPVLISVTADVNPRNLTVSGTHQLQITASFDDGTQLNVTSGCSGFHTDNAPVATVTADGLVTAVAAGTANITFIYAYGDQSGVTTVVVNVT